MTPRVALLAPLFMLLPACGARTLIGEGGGQEGSGLGAIPDGGLIQPLEESVVLDRREPDPDPGGGVETPPEPDSAPQPVEPPSVPPPPEPVAPPDLPVVPIPEPVMLIEPVAPPEPAVLPEPAPEPAPEPFVQPEPTVVVEPAVVVEPQPVIEPVPPEPAPAVEPNPAPLPEPQPEPDPLTMGGTCMAPVDLGTALGTVAVGSNTMASDSASVSCAVGGGLDVVFSWTAPSDGQYAIDTFGSDYDTTLALFAGPGCAGELSCNDDMQDLQSEVSQLALAGETLTIVLDAYAAESLGNYELNIELVPEPPEPPCEPVDLGSEVGLVAQGSLFPDASDFGGLSDCNGGARRVLFQWAAPAEGYYNFNTLGSSFDTVLVLRQSCGIAMLTCNDDYDNLTSSIDWNLTAGESVLLELSIYGDDPANGAPARPGPNGANYSLNIESL